MRPYFERHRLGDLAPFPVLPAPSVRACCLATVDQWAILPVYIVWRLIHTNIHHLWQFGVNLSLGPNLLLYYTKSDFLAYLPVLLPLLAIFTSHPLWWYVLAFQWHLQCWVCSRVQLRSLFEIMPPWAFWRAPISVRTLANVLFACLSWNLRRTVLFVACLCPSSESVETAPGTTWLKSTYLGQWHCWRHHTLIYHIYALKVIFHICLFKNAAACWLIMF